jgi:hypothetical protein
MMDGTLMVLGYDEPYSTWFAIHYDDRDEDAPPRAVIGSSPDEQWLLRAERPDAVIGPYPVLELADLFAEIESTFGIKGASTQPPCWSCRRPTYEPNPDCARHPYERLRYGT